MKGYAAHLSDFFYLFLHLGSYETKNINIFGKKFGTWKVNTGHCIARTSNLRDVVEIVDKKYNKVLNDSECQSSSVAKNSKSCLAPVTSSLNVNDNSLLVNSTKK